MTYICADCIKEPKLKEIVRFKSSHSNPCEYCDSAEPTVGIDLIAMKCDEVIATFYEVSSQTMAVLIYEYTPAGQSLSSLLSTLIGAPEDAIEAISEILQSEWYDEYSEQRLYGEDPWFILNLRMESSLSVHWEKIETSLRNEGRYLNPHVAKFMDAIFGGVSDDVSHNGLPVLVDAGPGTRYESIYRARVFQSEGSVLDALEHPEKSLGAPPVGVASSGRMNAAGQPAFYGASDVQTSLAEVRPVVGSWVVVSKFSIDRALKLLDLRRLSRVVLPETASLFDESTRIAAERRDFLRKLCDEMIRPVMPESQEQSYLVTQVVASYLATHPIASIDGIIYSSVQLGDGNPQGAGENVVLFYKSAITNNATNPERTAYAQLWAYDNDGPGRYFSPAIAFLDGKPAPSWHEKSEPHIKPTLSLVRESIEIHEIKSIQVTSDVNRFEVGEHHFNY